jgi:hypothetical protein
LAHDPAIFGFDHQGAVRLCNLANIAEGWRNSVVKSLERQVAGLIPDKLAL